MRAFIDDFKLIRLESYDYIHQVSINGNHGTWIKTDGLSQFFVMKYPMILDKDDKVTINGVDIPL